MRTAALLIALLVSSVHAQAQQEEASVTLRSTVTGNQEQPKVMYIVPWQQPAPAEFDYELQKAIADDLFTPVDRDEFARELEYGDLLQDATESTTPDVAAAHPQNTNNHTSNHHNKGD